MKILLLTFDYPPSPGGVGRYYHELIKNFPAGAAEVLIPTLALHWWPKWWPVFKQLRAKIKRQHCDVIWVGQVLPLGTVAWLRRLVGGQPYIVSAHGLDILLPQQSRWKKWLVRKILHRALLVTANSQYTAQQLSLYGVAKEKILILKPAATPLPDVSQPQRALFKQRQAMAGQPVMLAVGRLVRRKGFDRLLSLMPQIWSVMPTAELLIIGDGPERAALLTQIKNLPRPQVHLLTQATDADLAAAYQLADLLVLPARAEGADIEGFGIVCLEAASAGLPVIATAAGGVGEAVKHNQTGVLVPPDDQPALVKTILELLQNQPRRQSLGAAGQEWVKQFSWARNAQQLLKELQNRL